MTSRRLEKVYLELLETIRRTPHGRMQGVDVPSNGWAIDGRAVSAEERAEAVLLAEERGLIETTNVGGWPFPIKMTARGRALLDEFRSREQLQDSEDGS